MAEWLVMAAFTVFLLGRVVLNFYDRPSGRRDP